MIRQRHDGGVVPNTAECAKCDADVAMIDDVHHSDGSLCKIMVRNYAVTERRGFEPMGRYDPSRDNHA
jgi:recombinational DNA repair protein (RecF pathway)